MAMAEGTKLIAAYSRDKGRAEEFASKHGIRAAYTSLKDLLGDSRVDAVFIASHHHLHASHVEMAAQAGKHVLVEKPMALTVDEGLDMVPPRACGGPASGATRRARNRCPGSNPVGFGDKAGTQEAAPYRSERVVGPP